jgi:hypothetical protein
MGLCWSRKGLTASGASCVAVVKVPRLLFARHDAVNLTKFRRKPLLLGELVLEERHGQLLVVLYRVQVELVERVVCVELARVKLCGKFRN